MLYADKIIIYNIDIHQVLQFILWIHIIAQKLFSLVVSLFLQAAYIIHLRIQDKTDTNWTQLTMGWYFKISKNAVHQLRKEIFHLCKSLRKSHRLCPYCLHYLFHIFSRVLGSSFYIYDIFICTVRTFFYIFQFFC